MLRVSSGRRGGASDFLAILRRRKDTNNNQIEALMLPTAMSIADFVIFYGAWPEN